MQESAPVLQRAWATLELKALDADRRTLTGIASTPTLDRQGHIFEITGATYQNPIPLLLHHDTTQPIGAAVLTTRGGAIYFEASLPVVEDAGPLRERLAEVRQLLTAGLLRGVSIGFRVLEDGIEYLKGGVVRILKSEICELSLVTIPANRDASILTVKSLDLAASGLHVSRDRDPLPIVRVDKGAPRMEQKTINEQITSFENSRAAKHGRMTAIMTKSAEVGATLDQAETDEYDGLAAELKAVDAHLVRLRALEATTITKATPITATTPTEASAQRSGFTTVSVKANVAPGTALIRFAQALAVSKGSTLQAVEYAKRWHDSTPEVELVLKAAVAAGTTTDATWAGPLAPMKPITDEFIALLRPATILGKVPGFIQVPFNVSVASQTGGGSYAWVGQGAPKPVGKLTFGTVTLGITKCAGIIVITEELARTSTPSAEEVIKRDMINGIAAFLDSEFIDPSKAAVAGVSPGSVTNGVTPITTAGTTPANARTDIQALANAMTALNISTAGAVLILSETNALALTNALNPLGQQLFPGIGQDGGTIMGYKAIASQAAGTTVALVQPNNILYADDGGVTIDVSREASLQMDSAPMAVPDATTVLTSLWQMNLVGLRAERFINWKKARTGVVQYTVATYAA